MNESDDVHVWVSVYTLQIPKQLHTIRSHLYKQAPAYAHTHQRLLYGESSLLFFVFTKRIEFLKGWETVNKSETGRGQAKLLVQGKQQIRFQGHYSLKTQLANNSHLCKLLILVVIPLPPSHLDLLWKISWIHDYSLFIGRSMRNLILLESYAIPKFPQLSWNFNKGRDFLSCTRAKHTLRCQSIEGNKFT